MNYYYYEEESQSGQQLKSSKSTLLRNPKPNIHKPTQRYQKLKNKILITKKAGCKALVEEEEKTFSWPSQISNKENFSNSKTFSHSMEKL